MRTRPLWPSTGWREVWIGCAAADRGARPYDDVVQVIKLRNWLVHYKPKTLSILSPEKILDHVRDRFAENPLLDAAGPNNWFPHHALSAGCAQWAVDSVQAFIEDFVKVTGSTRTHHTLEHDEEP